jgi:Golgi apparatus protein 1
MNKPELTDDCHRAIFTVEKQELQDSSVDYTLLTTCKHMIRQFCHEEDQSQALVCLKVSTAHLEWKEYKKVI